MTGDILIFAWRRYLHLLRQKPLPTMAVTTGLVSLSSEFTAQKIQRKTRLNRKRLSLMTAYGLLYLGPYMHTYHKAMDRLFKGRSDLWTVIRKVVLDQLTSGPWNNFLYMTFSGLVLEDLTFSEVYKLVRERFLSVQLRSWTFWPVVSFFNNLVIPLQFRVLVSNAAAFAWTLYLIYQGTPRQRPRQIQGAHDGNGGEDLQTTGQNVQQVSKLE